ncbi:MAG: DUF2848 domain-containing protein [Pseudomonadota bacterium]
MPRLTFACVSAQGTTEQTVEIRDLVLAGWTGRDAAKVQEHIDELAEHGVAPPSRTPMFYRTSADLIGQSETLQALGPDTSGEVEYVLFKAGGAMWVTVGSDQTDRKREGQIGVALSKQLAGKVIARTAWALDEVLPHWDRIEISADVVSAAKRETYQQATLGDIKSPADLIRGVAGGGETLPDGTLLMSGTPPAIGGIRGADRFEMRLHDPVLGRTIAHTYDIEVLDIIA